MKKSKKGYLSTLQGKINASLVVIVVISVMSFMFISIQQTSASLKDTSSEYTLQLIQMVNENIEDYIENMDNIAEIVTSNSDVKSYLFSGESDVDAHVKYGGVVSSTFNTLMETRSDIYNIGVICSNGRYMINNRFVKINNNVDYKNLEWYSEALKGKEVITTSHVQNIVDEDYHWVVTLSRGINNLIDADTKAVFFVDLNYSAINNLCEEIDLGSKGYVYVIDNQGNLVYHPKQQLIYSGLWNEDTDLVLGSNQGVIYSKDGSRVYTISRSDKTGWTVVGVSYLDEMLYGVKRIRVTYFFMAEILICVALFLSILVSDMIISPLRSLRESMKTVEKGNFDIELEEPETGDEIADLFRSFKLMIRKIRQLLDDSIKTEKEKRRMELNALQAQINPHFLYNTLDSIIWMAEDGNTHDVVLMTSSLAKLLRKSISNKNEIVTINEEIEYTKSYLTIQKMRYKDKLEYEIDVPDSILYSETLKLIVQPLVENAIYHGIKNKIEGKGMISITGEQDDGKIYIYIKDNGIGMSAEQLEHIFDERETDRNKNGVGVRNVQSRIQITYGSNYGLDYESVVGMGTTVTISIPDSLTLEKEV